MVPIFWWRAMFTGLIESVGTVDEMCELPSGSRVRISTELAAELQLGDSIAVNGVCLTVAAVDASGFEADLSPETVRITALAATKGGSKVNLERPLIATAGRFGGHFVQGHVDVVGELSAIREETDFWWLSVSYPHEWGRYLVHKGSVALDGISLTIAQLSSDRFEVQIIPFTWDTTNLHTRSIGDRLNIECDIIGKYVARALDVMNEDLFGRDRLEGKE